MGRFLFATFAAFVFVFSVDNTEAASRNCTKAEKAEADDQLIAIAEDEAWRSQLTEAHLPFGAPRASGPTDNERTLVQGGYIMNHDDDLRTTLWVSYRLTAQDQAAAKDKDRVNCFRKDPRIHEDMTARPADYKEKRYDQGHMANDADLKDDLTEQINSYVMSNMSPQECRFNRGIWLSLEHITRAWAREYSTIYVTSGALFDRDNDLVRDDDAEAARMRSNNGKQRVAVPSHYYRVVVRTDGEGFYSIAFLLDHTNDAHGTKWADVRPHVVGNIVAIEDVEDKADLSLFPKLDRNEIIQSISGENWNFKNGASNLEGFCK